MNHLRLGTCAWFAGGHLYPVQSDVPKPIAQRTHDYLKGVGIG